MQDYSILSVIVAWWMEAEKRYHLRGVDERITGLKDVWPPVTSLSLEDVLAERVTSLSLKGSGS